MQTATIDALRPDHVDTDAVVDFDLHHDRRFVGTGDIHEAMRRFAAENPRGVVWTPRNGGHWIIKDYELLFQAVRNPALFSSAALTLPPMPPGREPHVLPISLDPPQHGVFRLPLMKAFAPDKVKAIEPDIRAFAVELIDAVADHGRCDFVDAVAEPLPVVIFMKFMGLDVSRLREFRSWVFDMLSNDDERRLRSHVTIGAMLDEVIAARRVQRRDDLISRLLDAGIDGRPVTDEEAHGYCLLLFAAGLDTVANSLSFGMNRLARDPELQERLRADRSAIPEAIEEFLRLYGVANVVRVVARDIEFGGARMKAGERVLMLLTVGNYDPGVFPGPDLFDLDRDNKLHLSFNSGPHRCIGSHLARIELRVFYEEWFARMPNVRLDPDRRGTFRAGQTLAMDTLPLVWTAG